MDDGVTFKCELVCSCQPAWRITTFELSSQVTQIRKDISLPEPASIYFERHSRRVFFSDNYGTRVFRIPRFPVESFRA
jgi:hypothetical protein